jgi:hypothetical protein
MRDIFHTGFCRMRYGRLVTCAIASGMCLLLLLFVVRTSGWPSAPYLTLSPYLTMFNCGALLLVVTLIAIARVRGINLRPAWPPIGVLIFNLSAALIFVVSASTISTDIKQLNVCIWLIWLGVIASAWELGTQLEINCKGFRVRQMVALVTAMFVVFSAAHLWRWSWEDIAPHRLRAIFHSGKLRGIISTPQKVENTEALLASLQRNAPSTDFLLSYGGFPGLSYLMNTRPALYSSIIGDDQPPKPLQGNWLEAARQHGIKPGVIVVLGEIKQRDSSVLDWLTGEYPPADRIGQYVVYLPKDENSSGHLLQSRH